MCAYIGEGGRLRAESRIDIRGDGGPDGGVIPTRSPSRDGGDEAKEGDEGLHLERLCVCCSNESDFDVRNDGICPETRDA